MESENTLSAGRDLDFYMTGTEQIPERDESEVCNDVPAQLPEYRVINT